MALNSGYVYREQLGRAAQGQTVLAYLTQCYKHSTPQEWQVRLAAGEVQVDGRVVSGEALLRPGQLLLWQRPPWHEPGVPLHYQTVYQDAHLLVVNKPSGLPTMPAGGFLEHTLLHLVRRTHPTASALHRLGRGTSGLVLFGLDGPTRAAVSQAWRTHHIQKTYLALSAGRATQDEYIITTPIGPVAHSKLGRVFAAHPEGKASHSLARVRERRANATLFEVSITTGRPHQIRIHLASIGLPLLGDPLYAAGGLPYPGSAALVSDLGYWLHAWKLGFVHPATGQRIDVQAERAVEWS